MKAANGTASVSMGVVAIVSVDLAQRAGHQAVARYLAGAIELLGRDVEVISLATSRSDRNSVRLVAPRTWGAPRVTSERFDDIDYRHVGCWFAELPWMRTRPRRQLGRLIGGCDVILVGAGTAMWGAVVPRRLRPRLIVSFVATAVGDSAALRERATGWRRWFWPVQVRLASRQERRVVRTARACIVPEPGLADWARTSGANATHVMSHAIADVFQPGSADHDGAIVAVSNWSDPRKNVELLIAAYRAAALVADLPELVLIGVPPPAEVVTAIQPSERIRVMGVLPQADLVSHLQGACLFVSSSDQEGFGVPIVEAMACGCAVLATKSGGSELTIEDGLTGVLVERGDLDAMAKAIVELVGDTERRATLGRTAHVAAEAFRLSAVAPQLRRIIGFADLARGSSEDLEHDS